MLAGNDLEELPASLCSISSLKVLNLDKNSLTALPDEISNMACLQELILSSNSLAILPASITCLGQLRELELQENRLTVLPAGLPAMPSLQLLNAAGNLLEELPDDLGLLTSLQFLDVRYVPEAVSNTSAKVYMFTTSSSSIPSCGHSSMSDTAKVMLLWDAACPVVMWLLWCMHIHFVCVM